VTLEKQIEEMKKDQENENEKKTQHLQAIIKQFEDKISGILEEQKRLVADLETNFANEKSILS
jgi:hypothetical protein